MANNVTINTKAMHKYLIKYLLNKLSKLLVNFIFLEPGEFSRFLKASSTSFTLDQSLKAPFYLTVNGFCF